MDNMHQKIYNKMTKYSKQPFDGYTHRFQIRFEIGEPYTNTLTLYSNDGSYESLEKFIEENKKEKVISYKIEYRSSKEQDDHQSKFLEDFLKDI